MGYLDSAGLRHFTAWVKSGLAGKQNTIAAGDGLSKTGDTLGVSNPNRGIYTRAEFDALTEEQKASGTYFVDDGGGGGSGGGVPKGVILIWSGTADDIPSGWALCDGQDGRPDLRGRFVYGAGTIVNRLVFTSTSHGQGGKSSEMTVTATKAIENLTVGYLVTSEAKYDKFSVYQGETVIVDGVSGENVSGEAQFSSLPAGTTLRFVYSKDGSGDKFEDQASFWLNVDGKDIPSSEKFGEVFQVTAEGEFGFSSEVKTLNPYPSSGENGGNSTVTLTTDNLPAHSHIQRIGIDGKPEIMRYEWSGGTAKSGYCISSNSVQELSEENPGTALDTSIRGSGEPFSIMPPYYALCYIIKL